MDTELPRQYDGTFIKIKHNFRRKHIHRTNEGINFLGKGPNNSVVYKPRSHLEVKDKTNIFKHEISFQVQSQPFPYQYPPTSFEYSYEKVCAFLVFPVDTELKLNVLCTFHLDPVSTGLPISLNSIMIANSLS